MNNLNIAGVYRKRRITLWLAFSGLVFALPAPASEQAEELALAPATKFSVQCGKEGSGSSNSTCPQGMYCNPDDPQPNRFSRCGSSEKMAGLDEGLLLLSLPRSLLYGE